jgi:hypothetical protein
VTTFSLQSVHATRVLPRQKRSRTQIVAKCIDIRRSLQRVTDNVSKRRVEEMGEDGIVDKRHMTPEEMVAALQIALVWLQRAENDIPHLRTLIERQLERESKETF